MGERLRQQMLQGIVEIRPHRRLRGIALAIEGKVDDQAPNVLCLEAVQR